MQRCIVFTLFLHGTSVLSQPNNGNFGTSPIDGVGVAKQHRNMNPNINPNIKNYAIQQYQVQESDSVIDDSIPSHIKHQEGSILSTAHKDEDTDLIMSRFGGTFIGFGLGHFFQDRWLERGWLFTVSHLLLLPIKTSVWPLYGQDENFNTGLSLYLLSKAIEIYDIWSWPATEQKPQSKISVQWHKNSQVTLVLTRQL